MDYSKKAVAEALAKVNSTMGDRSIIEAGHVKNIQLFGDEVVVDAVSTSPVMHIKKKLEVEIIKTLHNELDPKLKVQVNIEVLKTAKQTTNMIRGAKLPGVKNIIAIASGKGGVGKSTITANLAVNLANMGFSVGLIDADIYGPSQPAMFDVLNAKPGSIHIDGKDKMDPVESYGVKLLSIGFFAAANQAVVWRGPMASKALNQLINDAHWGELDFMLIDLPPGTGDIHLSLVQVVPVTGAVIISTPQNIALSDARKGVAMFQIENINVPVLGMVENMSYFSPEELPANKYYVFGKDGVKNLCKELQVPFLGEIPLVQSIRESGDVGCPIVLQKSSPIGKAFEEITCNTVMELMKRNKELPSTEVTRITTMAGCSAVNTREL